MDHHDRRNVTLCILSAELISLVQGCTFDRLQENILDSLTAIFFTSTALGKARLLGCFTSIVKRWANLDWAEWAAQEDIGVVQHATEKQAARHTTDLQAGPIVLATVSIQYRPLYDLIRYVKSFFHVDESLASALILVPSYVDRMCVLGLIAERNHALVQHASLCFLEVVHESPF